MPNRASGKENGLFSETTETKVLMPLNHNGCRSIESNASETRTMLNILAYMWKLQLLS